MQTLKLRRLLTKTNRGADAPFEWYRFNEKNAYGVPVIKTLGI